MKRKVFYVSSDDRGERHERCAIVYYDEWATSDEIEEISESAAMDDAYARGEWFEWISPSPTAQDWWYDLHTANESQHYSA